MFVRHLLGSSSLSTTPIWQTSDIGTFGHGLGGLSTYYLDRAGNTLYLSASRPANSSQGDTVDLIGTVGPTGLLPVLQTIKNQQALYLYRPDKTGVLHSPVGSGPARSVPGYTRWILGEKGTAFYLATDLGSATISGYSKISSDVVYVDQATGAQFKVGTVVAPQVPGKSTLYGHFVGSDIVVLSAPYLGYQSPTGATWSVVLQASNGRAKRAKIPKSIANDSSVYWKLRAAPTPEAIAFSPWRRPLTADTRVRAMSIAYDNGGAANRTFTRRGVSYSPVSVGVHEIDISPATGSGSGVTYHTMSYHFSAYFGVLVIDGSSTRFITTSKTIVDDTTQLSQYVNADGSPSGEYIVTSKGSFEYVPPAGTITGRGTAFMVTVNNILTRTSPTTFDVLDLDGNFVKSGTFPIANSTVLYLLQSADVLLTNMQAYLDPGYVSYDFGTTWKKIQFWGPRGSVKGSGLNDSQQPYTSQLATLSRTFYT